MDRVIVYVDEQPLDTDFLNAQKNAMIGLGMLAQAVLGTSTEVDGLACTPTGPASLQVLVGPGSIYSYANVDGTAYGSLSADTAHQTVKQGINLGTLTLNCPVPATTGQSVNYLIQAAYQDTDAGTTVLPYYDADNPSEAFNGPDGLGTSNMTVREGQCIVSAKAGIAATTGTQTTPSPDAGYTGLWVVTVAHTDTAINSGAISAASGAPFILEKLKDKIGQTTGDARYLRQSNNLSDLGNVTTALTNLGFVESFATAGYQKLPGGLIIQWGSASSVSTSGTPISFPITFPNNVYSVVGGQGLTSVGAGSAAFNPANATTSGFTAYMDAVGGPVTDPYCWIAIGR